MKNFIISILCVALLVMGTLIYVGTHDIKSTEKPAKTDETGEELATKNPVVDVQIDTMNVEVGGVEGGE